MLDSIEAVLSYANASDDLLRPWLKSIYISAEKRVFEMKAYFFETFCIVLSGKFITPAEKICPFLIE